MTQQAILIRGGTVIDPANDVHGKYEVRLRGTRVDAVGENLSSGLSDLVVDAAGCLVIPGLVDTHVHLSEPFGGPQGHRMLARAGVTCALDMAGRPRQLIDGIKSGGVGITVGFVYALVPGDSLTGLDPKKEEIQRACNTSVENGALGIKLLGGHYPLTPEATALAIRTAADVRCWCAVHCGTSKTGSDITGLEELLELADGLPVHVAHVNSYCRGQHTGDPLEEASRAVAALARAPRARSESYLATINGANALIVDGVPKSNVVKTCLKLGGFPATASGLHDAILSGWAMIQGMEDWESALLPPEAGLAYYTSNKTNVGISFPVNPPGSAISIALARKDKEFVVTALSTDGGAIPRNTTVEQGLALVEFGALSLDDFVRKACLNAARMFGLKSKGHLGPGADADVAIIDPAQRKATWVIANGQVVVRSGTVVGKGGRIATTARGVPFLQNAGIECVTAAPDWI
jgi:predicted amidohydrolase